MADRALEILSLDEATRDFVRRCEVTGERSVVLRNGRPIAIMISMDEYVALRETLALVNEPETARELEEADAQLRRGAILAAEDLFVE